MNEEEVVGNLEEVLEKQELDDESVLTIVYQPQAVFRVRSITRCVSSLEGMLVLNFLDLDLIFQATPKLSLLFPSVLMVLVLRLVLEIPLFDCGT